MGGGIGGRLTGWVIKEEITDMPPGEVTINGRSKVKLPIKN